VSIRLEQLPPLIAVGSSGDLKVSRRPDVERGSVRGHGCGPARRGGLIPIFLTKVHSRTNPFCQFGPARARPRLSWIVLRAIGWHQSLSSPMVEEGLMPESLTRRKTPANYLSGGPFQIGTVAGFISEWWPASNRNSGRLHVGTTAGLNRNLA